MVSLLTIGDELLYGQVVDTNAAHIASFLDEQGYSLARKCTCPDLDEAIVDSLRFLAKHSDILLVTGGLGPTHDDRTRFALATLLGVELEQSEKAYQALKAKYEQRGRELKPNNLLQTQLPNGSRYVENPIGTACGMACEWEGKLIITMPGVPREMKAMLRETVLPEMQRFRAPRRVLHEVLMTATVPESRLADTIQEWQNALPPELSLAYLPGAGAVKLRITGKGLAEEALAQSLKAEKAKLQALIAEFVYADSDVTLEEQVLRVMAGKNLSLATAESCTGGFVAHRLTAVPGSSAYFKGSVVAYANKVKEKVLGVKQKSLNKHGAVSKAVVKQMAEGARKHLKTDYALATSGVAGPSGGTDEKPVGTVWIALSGPKGTNCKLLRLSPNRALNIQLTSTHVLFMLLKEVQG